MSFFFSVLSCFLQIERERERGWYIKLGIRRNSPKVTYLIFRRGSTGESFFFYGLIDFMLFLTLAWRTWVPRARRYFFVFFTRSTWLFGSASNEPCPTTNFLIIYFRWREGVPTSVLGSQPIIWLLSSSSWPGDFLGLLDVTQVPFFFHQVTQYKHLFFHSDLCLLLWDWPTFFHVLTAILLRHATLNSNGRIVLILFLTSQWDTTWQYIYIYIYIYI